jgi:flavodoxin
MNTLILYDSQFGNTERIAQAIASTLNTYGAVKITRVDRAQLSDLRGVDLLVLGCPTQKWRITPAMKSFLNLVSSQIVQGVAIACFDTRLDNMDWLTSSAAQGIARKFARMDITMLAPPESFIVESRAGPLAEGELERASKWAEVLHGRLDDRLEQHDALVTA